MSAATPSRDGIWRYSSGGSESFLPLQIFAHRGHHTDHPENTVGAFDAATAIGAHGIELDLHLSRDGRPVVLHDAAVDRTTDGSGSVANLNWAALRQLDAGAGERIPTFDQVLQTAASSLRLNEQLDMGHASYEVSLTRRPADDVTVTIDDIWEDGHCSNAGEACFTESGRLRCIFQATTGCEIPEGW